MKKISLLFLLIVFMGATFSCTKTRLIVGEGSKSGIVNSQKNWYILWGAVPIIEANQEELIGDAKNYEYVTETDLLDSIINAAGIMLSVGTRTVKVIK